MQAIACHSQHGDVTLKAESTPFSLFPGQSKLFLDYQRDPVSLRRYYPNAVASVSDLAAYIPTVLEHYRSDRGILCDALAETNVKFGAGSRTFENIELLRQNDTVAVVTGQQAGLLTGPLYTLYKALSSIKEADALRANGHNAVPIFWVATEDHDFEEVSQTFVIDRHGDLVMSKTEPANSRENLPVGYIKLDESIEDVTRELIDELQPTEFTEDLRLLLDDCWRPGEYFGDAFGRMLTRLIGDRGLIILCPLNPKLKQLAAPLYAVAIRRSAEIVTALRERSSELVADGYAAQVLVGEDYFPMFWQAPDDTRNALRMTENGTVRQKAGSREFSLDELAAIAVDDPIRLSPSVVLRSVVQDFILPSVCYFGGAAEIAYFAQSGEVYRLLDRPVTPILHRQSFTFVESKHAKTMARYGLKLPDLFQGLDKLLPEIVERHLNTDAAKMFAEVEEAINIQLNKLDQGLSTLDAGLLENLAKRRRKIIYHIGALRHKFHNAQIRKDEVVRYQIETMFTALLPHKHLQERSLNVAYFVNRYGPNFVDWICNAIDLDDKTHRVISL